MGRRRPNRRACPFHPRDQLLALSALCLYLLANFSVFPGCWNTATLRPSRSVDSHAILELTDNMAQLPMRAWDQGSFKIPFANHTPGDQGGLLPYDVFWQN
ncbi:hypothetical protein OE88DRAFT_368447 [Heliocybe sulcata]|uniref:Uncharacterized protein n=1 Tax=Heliocybe sulcata TaxID=5364 RepID=A0A5C3MXN7_9AGAM|nr:hypothetical protein OE88DRAFT_368447 [Heliocybe sulcata]